MAAATFYIDRGNIQPHWLTPDLAPAHQWIDLQYDVTASDIQLAARENFVSVEHVKRYTANGMSLDQGKTSNVNGLGDAIGRPIPQVGTTRFRGFFTSEVTNGGDYCAS